MHTYRTHTCADLNVNHVEQTVRLSGWVHRKRDHGNLLFIDIRDHYGLTQCVVDVDSESFKILDSVRSEYVICVTGNVVLRTEDTINNDLTT
ncbi:MAG: OB-fold nucleic acid binding domain-containing protein, partial [Sphingomonadales bacterium]